MSALELVLDRAVDLVDVIACICMHLLLLVSVGATITVCRVVALHGLLLLVLLINRFGLHVLLLLLRGVVDWRLQLLVLVVSRLELSAGSVLYLRRLLDVLMLGRLMSLIGIVGVLGDDLRLSSWVVKLVADSCGCCDVPNFLRKLSILLWESLLSDVLSIYLLLLWLRLLLSCKLMCNAQRPRLLHRLLDVFLVLSDVLWLLLNKLLLLGVCAWLEELLEVFNRLAILLLDEIIKARLGGLVLLVHRFLDNIWGLDMRRLHQIVRVDQTELVLWLIGDHVLVLRRTECLLLNRCECLC